MLKPATVVALVDALGTPMARRRTSAAGTIVAAVLLLGACAATQDAVDWVDTVIGGTTPESRKATDVPNQVGKPYRVNGAWYVPRIDRNYDAVGRASWYGRPFHGRRTASGQIFNMNALTAAHRTLPLGTRVRVTNLANGRSVVVIINDRGPFVKGRIIDVSRHAARRLGFQRKGTARVRVRVVDSTRG